MSTPSEHARRRITAVHAAIAGPSTLLRERRALYQLAAELLQAGCSQELGLDVIDSPVTRNQIGDALAGRRNLTCLTFVSISAITDPTYSQDLPVVSCPDANTLLARALDPVRTELNRQQVTFGSLRLLTEVDGERFISALAVLSDGVALARSVNAELVDDLLPHIALIGVVDSRGAGRLASASPRIFPGLILLKSPQSSIEVAEALVHEGAHQKLFDLAVTRDLLNADSDRCPPFHPPWAPKERLWPLEQTLAACHAYVCLAQFAHDAGIRTGSHVVGPDSLLPVASMRYEIIGQWLLEQGDYLGIDAHTLVKGLIGQRPRTSPTTEIQSTPVAANYIIDPRLRFRRCDFTERVLVGRLSHPPQFYWVSDDAATALDLLAQKSLDEVIRKFAERWGLDSSDTSRRLTELLSDLYVAGLVELGATECN